MILKLNLGGGGGKASREKEESCTNLPITFTLKIE